MITHKNSKLALLAGIPLFEGLPKRELERLASLADEVEVPAGVDLTVEGRLGHEAFVLLSGGAVAHRGGNIVRTLEPGSLVGEIAVLGGGPRTATVTTTAPSRMLVIAAPDFRRLVRDSQLLPSRILHEVARRLAA
jgi:CRP/FNR family cyclic AMP-dependent transcriptional regulator